MKTTEALRRFFPDQPPRAVLMITQKDVRVLCEIDEYGASYGSIQRATELGFIDLGQSVRRLIENGIVFNTGVFGPSQYKLTARGFAVKTDLFDSRRSQRVDVHVVDEEYLREQETGILREEIAHA